MEASPTERVVRRQLRADPLIRNAARTIMPWPYKVAKRFIDDGSEQNVIIDVSRGEKVVRVIGRGYTNLAYRDRCTDDIVAFLKEIGELS